MQGINRISEKVLANAAHFATIPKAIHVPYVLTA